MLRIYYENDVALNNKEIINNVEAVFPSNSIPDVKEVRNFIKCIDKGTYLNEEVFTDRYGINLYNQFLSTGCKAAICVVVFPDKVVNTKECGINAKEAIIQNCTQGAIILEDNSEPFAFETDSIDVYLEGYRFKSMARLNHYISNERMLMPEIQPDLNKDGIEVWRD